MSPNTHDLGAADEAVHVCDVCGRVISPDEVHYYHDDDCPNFRQDRIIAPCACSGEACPECCPECQE